MKKSLSLIISVLFILSICLCGCSEQANEVDYSDNSNWAYFETDTTDKTADVFFACPTVYFS